MKRLNLFLVLSALASGQLLAESAELAESIARNPSAPLNQIRATSGQRSLALQSVFISRAQRHAIIDGQLLREGQRLGVYKVQRIGADGVLLIGAAGAQRFLPSSSAQNIRSRAAARAGSGEKSK